MKKYIVILTVLMMFLCFSCSSDEKPQQGPMNETQPPLQNQPMSAQGKHPGAYNDIYPMETDDISFEKEVLVVPDDVYDTGAFCRVFYVEQNDNLIVTFGAKPLEVTEKEVDDTEYRAGGQEAGDSFAYKEYSLDMEPTGNEDSFYYGGGDCSMTMGDNYFYLLTGGPKGWVLAKYNPITWEQLKKIDIETDSEMEGTGDSMIAYVNGQLDASGIYKISEVPNGDDATHHRLFSTDLEFLKYQILDDMPHVEGTSMVYVDNTYQFLSSTSFFGDILVMQYDNEWNFLDSKIIAENGNWPQGTVYDEERERYYVAYTSGAGVRYINLGVYDKDWDMIETIKVTDFDENAEERQSAGRPSVFMHDNKLYVSYDINTLSEETGDTSRDWNCLVRVYDLA
ncbi:MAG: hypothetical protein WC254_03710 [Candidatus Woesearchaeota archaeon]